MIGGLELDVVNSIDGAISLNSFSFVSLVVTFCFGSDTTLSYVYQFYSVHIPRTSSNGITTYMHCCTVFPQIACFVTFTLHSNHLSGVKIPHASQLIDQRRRPPRDDQWPLSPKYLLVPRSGV